MHIATFIGLRNDLVPALIVLRTHLGRKAIEFRHILKVGRTHLMDAVPMTLGKSFNALARQSKFESLGANEILVEVSGVLKCLATTLLKIATDIRALGSGPCCGFDELVIPHAWRFCMYSTAKPIEDVKHAIADPRADHSFACNEECFATIYKLVSDHETLKHSPLKYSKFTKSQASLESSARTAVKLHPELIVVVDNEAPVEKGVVIARLVWDQEAERSEDELSRVWKESRVETQKCEVDSFLETLERMADDGNE